MRWVTGTIGGSGPQRVGLLEGDRASLLPVGPTLVELLGDAGARLRQAAKEASSSKEQISVADLHLSSPVPNPPSVRDFQAFEEHVRNASGSEVPDDWYDLPVFYFSNPAAIMGVDDLVPVAPGSNEFDFEIEIAAIIGMSGTNLTLDVAWDHIAGFAIFCDWSARDLQRREMALGLGPAKGKDTASTLGPWLLTRDELEPDRLARGFDLRCSARVNGRPYTSGSFREMYWSFPQMIVYASRGTTVQVGDVIGSGTVPKGCILELARLAAEESPPFLGVGDQVVIHVDKLGELRARLGESLPIQPL